MRKNPPVGHLAHDVRNPAVLNIPPPNISVTDICRTFDEKCTQQSRRCGSRSVLVAKGRGRNDIDEACKATHVRAAQSPDRCERERERALA